MKQEELTINNNINNNNNSIKAFHDHINIQCIGKYNSPIDSLYKKEAFKSAWNK